MKNDENKIHYFEYFPQLMEGCGSVKATAFASFVLDQYFFGELEIDENTGYIHLPNSYIQNSLGFTEKSLRTAKSQVIDYLDIKLNSHGTKILYKPKDSVTVSFLLSYREDNMPFLFCVESAKQFKSYGVALLLSYMQYRYSIFINKINPSSGALTREQQRQYILRIPRKEIESALFISKHILRNHLKPLLEKTKVWEEKSSYVVNYEDCYEQKINNKVVCYRSC